MYRALRLSLCVVLSAVALSLPGCGGGSGGGPALPIGDAEVFSVTITGLWTSGSHAGDIPPGAHFSPPVGAVHSTPDVLWAHNGARVASPGIESMAEAGTTPLLLTEVAATVTAGDARGQVVGAGFDATGISVVTVTATEAHHLLTLVTMIAPSPDWFVGLQSFDLRPGGVWIDQLQIDLNTVYDAGTDSGTTFLSGDADLTPHIPIRLVADEGNHFLGTPAPLVRIVIQRLP